MLPYLGFQVILFLITIFCNNIILILTFMSEILWVCLTTYGILVIAPLMAIAFSVTKRDNGKTNLKTNIMWFGLYFVFVSINPLKQITFHNKVPLYGESVACSVIQAIGEVKFEDGNSPWRLLGPLEQSHLT